ncbi:bifunctional enoyl-CoA hydratase/phosphate acetyltransferase [Gaoshiqia sediminis]|uniref:Bifunctional enoyl-CoA hydratase/phosphate acetyltransferase n=1 Tax=Gaoshiqia sediminis TaxID=2986998 RepID=A0AA41YAB8_9BACT|nr:bifunctional enoyl-CoA hydratase/phosphate acetyltransferase [Gaoshiqia sediminis]MCW0484905.1 bifunctional enoyl-CoA hydratase/phosphate acetyltransferase [Gaoshiqia sediminis]
MIKQLNEIIALAKKGPVRKMVLVNGIDSHSLEAARLAIELGFIKLVITGPRAEIRQVCQQLNMDFSSFEIIEANNEDDAALTAVKMVNSGKADLIMKGLISTDKYMRALLNKEFGLLPHKGVLSHVSVIENPNYHKLLIVSDVAVIPYPDFSQKVAMANYLIQTAHVLGIDKPKVAVIAATEQVLPSIQACTDAAMLSKMAERGQITGALVDGPMALDVALDRESAEIKKINSSVAGDADCLLFPNIDAGNVFYKMGAKLCRSEQAAVVMGARVPAILSSRGDSTQTKLYSIALAALLSK